MHATGSRDSMQEKRYIYFDKKLPRSFLHFQFLHCISVSVLFLYRVQGRRTHSTHIITRTHARMCPLTHTVIFFAETPRSHEAQTCTVPLNKHTRMYHIPNYSMRHEGLDLEDQTLASEECHHIPCHPSLISIPILAYVSSKVSALFVYVLLTKFVLGPVQLGVDLLFAASTFSFFFWTDSNVTSRARILYGARALWSLQPVHIMISLMAMYTPLMDIYVRFVCVCYCVWWKMCTYVLIDVTYQWYYTDRY